MTTLPNPILVMPSTFRPKWPIDEEHMDAEDLKDHQRVHFFDGQPGLLFARMKVGKTWVIAPENLICPVDQHKPDGSNAPGPEIDDLILVKEYMAAKVKARRDALNPIPVVLPVVEEVVEDVDNFDADDGEQHGKWERFLKFIGYK